MIKFTRLLACISLLALVSCSANSPSATKSPSDLVEETKTCLVGFDWVYPASGEPTGAWKFSADGTFNSSTTYFGGMSTWGNWQVISPNKIKISYTKTSEGILPDDQVLTLTECNTLMVGATAYSKQ
jgi:hypothetical protein